ncbi:hypothetical protein DB346_00165 [Verrucomicrobia bacterium LW23]|nr:hypothetical protein DB346_00165 [Verrucomicrobia bacterium LW23]
MEPLAFASLHTAIAGSRASLPVRDSLCAGVLGASLTGARAGAPTGPEQGTPLSATVATIARQAPIAQRLVRLGRILMLPMLVFILALACVTPSHADPRPPEYPRGEKARDGVGGTTATENWYKEINIAGRIMIGAIVFCGMGITYACIMLSGSIRAVICVVFCLIMIGFADPQTVTEPLTRYPEQVRALIEKPTMPLRIWVMAHAMLFVFTLVLILSVGLKEGVDLDDVTVQDSWR